MDTFGEFTASRPSLLRSVAVKLFVFMAGVLLMLARTSPALAADSHGDKGKAATDKTSASLVVHRSDPAPAKSDHPIGGGAGGDGSGGGKDKNSGSGGASAKGGASTNSDASAKSRSRRIRVKQQAQAKSHRSRKCRVPGSDWLPLPVAIAGR